MARNNLSRMATTNPWSTTLDGDISATDTTITLASVTGLQAPGYLVVERQDGSGTDTPTVREYVYFSAVDSGAKTVTIPSTSERGLFGSTAQTHSDGALVEEVLTTGHHNGLYTTVAAALNDAGTALAVSSATITTLRTNYLMSVLSVGSGAPVPEVFAAGAPVASPKILRGSNTATTDGSGNATIDMGKSITLAMAVITNGDDDVNSGDLILSVHVDTPASYYGAAQQYLPVKARVATTGSTYNSNAIRVNWIAIGT